MNLKHSFDHLLGDRDAMEEAGPGGAMPGTNGAAVVPYPVIATEDDGSIAFSLNAPGLVESSISVKQDGAGKYTATADMAESVHGRQKTDTHFAIKFVLPPEVAGEATPSYDGAVLRITIAPR